MQVSIPIENISSIHLNRSRYLDLSNCLNAWKFINKYNKKWVFSLTTTCRRFASLVNTPEWNLSISSPLLSNLWISEMVDFSQAEPFFSNIIQSHKELKLFTYPKDSELSNLTKELRETAPNWEIVEV